MEMGPDSMTVNSISAEVVTTDENGVQTSHTSESASTGKYIAYLYLDLHI